MHDTKLSGYKIVIRFNKNILVVEQNIHEPKIVYVSDDWPKIPLNNFKLNNCLFCATNIVKNCDKSICIVVMGIAFDGADSWRFDNEFAKNS